MRTRTLARSVPVAALVSAALTLILAAPAPGGIEGGGTVTVVPQEIATTDPVTVTVTGEGCADDLADDASIIVTITDPDGQVVHEQTFDGAPSVSFTFDDTLTPGTYTVEAVCDVVPIEGGSGTLAVAFTYTPAGFTAFEPGLGDPRFAVDDATAGVVAATPTFTG